MSDSKGFDPFQTDADNTHPFTKASDRPHTAVDEILSRLFLAQQRDLIARNRAYLDCTELQYHRSTYSTRRHSLIESVEDWVQKLGEISARLGLSLEDEVSVGWRQLQADADEMTRAEIALSDLESKQDLYSHVNSESHNRCQQAAKDLVAELKFPAIIPADVDYEAELYDTNPVVQKLKPDDRDAQDDLQPLLRT